MMKSTFQFFRLLGPEAPRFPPLLSLALGFSLMFIFLSGELTGCSRLNQCLQDTDCTKLESCAQSSCVCQSGLCKQGETNTSENSLEHEKTSDLTERTIEKPGDSGPSERAPKERVQETPKELTPEPLVEPTPEKTPLGKPCEVTGSTDVCGTGYFCSGFNGTFCFQDCQLDPSICAKNQDGRIHCIYTRGGQKRRRVCIKKGLEGDRCLGPESWGKTLGCDLDIGLFCNHGGICEQGILVTKEGGSCRGGDPTLNKPYICDYKNYKLRCDFTTYTCQKMP